MNANQLQNVSKNRGRSLGPRAWWLGASLAIAAALAIAVAIRYAPAPKIADTAVRAQTVPSAADQGIMNYLRAHGFGATSQTVPSAADQGVMNYLRAHGAGTTGQTVPDAADQGVMNYLRVHGFAGSRQTVPSAADQGVMNYLRAHGAGATNQTVPDPAWRGAEGFLRAHGGGSSVQTQSALDAGAQAEQVYLRSHPARHGAPDAIPQTVITGQPYVPPCTSKSCGAPPLCGQLYGAGCDGQRVLVLP
jgi:hypothetical protein